MAIASTQALKTNLNGVKDRTEDRAEQVGGVEFSGGNARCRRSIGSVEKQS